MARSACSNRGGRKAWLIGRDAGRHTECACYIAKAARAEMLVSNLHGGPRHTRIAVRAARACRVGRTVFQPQPTKIRYTYAKRTLIVGGPPATLRSIYG